MFRVAAQSSGQITESFAKKFFEEHKLQIFENAKSIQATTLSFYTHKLYEMEDRPTQSVSAEILARMKRAEELKSFVIGFLQKEVVLLSH